MPVTETQLRSLLEQAGVQCGPSRKGAVPLIFAGGGRPLLVAVKPESVLQFRTLGMLHATQQSCRRELLMALMSTNSRFKLIKFAFDPNDGEIAGYIDVMVEDGILDASQVKRCVDAIKLMIKCRERFSQIIETGVDPGQDDWEGADSFLRHLNDLVDGARAGGDAVKGFDDLDDFFADNTEVKTLGDTFSGVFDEIQKSGKHR